MYGRPRCREWTPLVTQQLRLRNLIQITGHNLQTDRQCSFYYTLHITSMCAPFYTSEKIENNNPAWCDIDSDLVTKSSSKCIFIRIWKHFSKDEDDVIFLKWGVFFSGLVNIENRSSFHLIENSLIFQMNGGFFTSYECLLNKNPLKIYISIKKDQDSGVVENEAVDAFKVKYTNLKFLNSEIRQSYDIDKLLQLHVLQLIIKNRFTSANELREKICLRSPICLENNTDCKAKLLEHRKKFSRDYSKSNKLNWYILQQSPQPDPEKTLKALQLYKQIEYAKCICRLLNVETDCQRVKLRMLQNKKSAINESNNDLGSDLMNNFHSLSKDRECCKKMKLLLQSLNDSLNVTRAALRNRQAKLLSEILTIYPITEGSKDVMNILNVPLPNAESLNPNHSTSLSVALGFVAHAIHMVSVFLQVPLRYPLVHLGSRSKIIDNVTDNIPDNEREFPLHSKSNPSGALHYGVYLLNKNIAQLRWSLLGLATKDLRATLPNLKELLLGLCLRENSVETLQSMKSLSEAAVVLSGSPQNLTQNNILKSYNYFQARKPNHRISRLVESYTENQLLDEYIGNCTSEPALCTKSTDVSHNISKSDCVSNFNLTSHLPNSN